MQTGTSKLWKFKIVFKFEILTHGTHQTHGPHKTYDANHTHADLHQKAGCLCFCVVNIWIFNLNSSERCLWAFKFWFWKILNDLLLKLPIYNLCTEYLENGWLRKLWPVFFGLTLLHNITWILCWSLLTYWGKNWRMRQQLLWFDLSHLSSWEQIPTCHVFCICM